MKDNSGNHAIVLGAGIAGLFAARIASEFYPRVTVVDRDDLSDTVTPRRGVPQGEHAHDLLIRGQQIAEELFPGISEELVAAGGQRGDLSGNVRWIFGVHPFQQVNSGLEVVASSRPFREWHIRERVRALPQVTLLDNTDVDRLISEPDGNAVTGVAVSRNGTEETLAADLVIDTTGRGSRTPAWLAELGYPRVMEEKRRIDVGYVTYYCRTPPEALNGDIVINAVASPEVPRGGSCQRVDGDRTIVTAYGLLGEQPPTDFEGFRAFAKTFATPDTYDVLERSEPISEPARYRFPANLRRRYEQMSEFPAGLLVVGDAVCSFNPIYGQGMTVSIKESLVLREHLRRSARPNPVEFFRDLTEQVIEDAWQMAIVSDLSIPDVPGDRPEDVVQLIEYVGGLQGVAQHDGAAAVACLRVFGLLDPLTGLMDPALVDKVSHAGSAVG